MQSYYITGHGGEFLARGRADGEGVHRGPAAAEALQAAMDALDAQGGGEAYIDCGEYPLARPVEIPSGATVRGSGRATVLRPAPGNAEGVLLRARERDGVVIADLTCQGAADGPSEAGVVLEACGDSEVRGVFARDFAACGIVMRRGCFTCRLLGNTTAGNGGAGTRVVDCAGGGRGGNFVPNLLSHCQSIGERGHGFELSHAICTNLVGCQAHQPLGHGFYFHETSNSTCLVGGRVFEAEGNGILAENTHELNVTGNIICWNRGHGLEMDHVIWGAVSGNCFIDNGGTTGEMRHGIALHTDTRSVQVTGNAVFNWQGHLPMRCGIHEADDCRNNAITHNNINYVTEGGVVCRGAGSVASGNTVVEAAYSHPERQPFAPPREDFLTRPFTRDAVEAFLNRTRRG